MKASGKMTFNLVEEQKHGKMALNMPATTKKAKSKAMAHIPGLMAQCTKEIGLITRSMALVSTNGKMVVSIMAIGKKTTCMDLVYIFTLMA